jgi:hypothetical protein
MPLTAQVFMRILEEIIEVIIYKLIISIYVISEFGGSLFVIG